MNPKLLSRNLFNVFTLLRKQSPEDTIYTIHFWQGLLFHISTFPVFYPGNVSWETEKLKYMFDS